MSELTIALLGNPNSGKTTLFNALTGSNQQVGNWPGVTVERKEGQLQHAGHSYKLVDLPGTYTVSADYHGDSIDQQIAQQYVMEGEADLLINIIDATALERGLYLTSQLLDAGTPLVVALNMMDVADRQGIHIDTLALGEALGVPVIPIVASKGEGIRSLLDIVSHRIEARPPQQGCHLGNVLEEAIDELLAHKPELSRQAALALLQQAQLVDSVAVSAIADTTSKELDSDIESALINARYQWVAQACENAVDHEEQKSRSLTDWLDALFLNRILAFPLFLGVMYLMFMATINVGGAFIDFFDQTANILFVQMPKEVFDNIGLPGWMTALLADGVGGGVQLVASFIPVIGALFLFQAFLEASGYMARAAFIMDRIMRSVGLPGKSFVPLIVGFGCNVPAVMASRTLDTQTDRLLTTLMAPFMSCGARLTVYVLFAAAFFPENGQNVVFALYLIGIALAIASGFIVRKHILVADVSPYILELPNYHVPTLRGLFMRAWQRLKGFIVRAGKAIVLVVVVLNFLNSIGTDGSYGNENSENSVLSVIGKTITPVFSPMGVKEENWPATVGIFSGVFAKEVVVGTLDALYGALASEGQFEQEESIPYIEQFEEALATIPENMAGLNELWGDPLGLSVGDLSDQATVAEEQEVAMDTLTLMAALFGSQLAAFAYILFVLLYMPCVATLGAIYKEAGGYWAFFSASWNTLIAYALAVMCFQLGNWSEQPAEAAAWTVGMLMMLFIGYRLLLRSAQKEVSNSNIIPSVQL